MLNLFGPGASNQSPTTVPPLLALLRARSVEQRDIRQRLYEAEVDHVLRALGLSHLLLFNGDASQCLLRWPQWRIMEPPLSPESRAAMVFCLNRGQPLMLGEDAQREDVKFLHRELALWGLKSALLVPCQLFDGRNIIAALDREAHECPWPAALIDECRTVIEFLALVDTLANRTEGLQRSEEQFRKLFEWSHEGIALFRDRRLIDCNRRACEITGYERSELVGLSAGSLAAKLRFAQESRELTRGSFHRAEAGEVVEFEWLVRRKDGAPRTLLCCVQALHFGEGNFLYLSMRDVSDVKSLETVLDEQSRHFGPLLADERVSLSVMEILGGDQFRFVMANRGFCHLNGLPATFNPVGLELGDVLQPRIGAEGVARVREAYARCFRTGKPMNRLADFPTGDRDTTWNTHLTPVRSQDGAIRQLVVIGIDATRQVVAEQQLRLQNQFMDTIFEGAANSFGSVDVLEGPVFRVARVNRYWRELTGLRTEDVVGKTFEQLVGPFPKEDIETLQGLFARCFHEGESFSYEQNRRINGRDVRWYTTLIPLRDERGNIHRIVSSAVNVEPLRAAEQKLAAALAEITELKNQLQAENYILRRQVQKAQGFEALIGTSASLQDCLELVDKVARLNTTVLLLGETGTGKELVARTIHEKSEHRDGPLVSVNCAAISHHLFESELFGHERGAFTGAIESRRGRLEQAEGGTLFLDEIGELDVAMQTKLLRALENGVYQRVGGTKDLKLKARVVAATNRDLEADMAKGLFRSDLFYRINRFPIRVPPLRERGDDVFLLASHFARRFAESCNKQFKDFSPELRRFLATHTFEGNVRELQNLIERSTIVSTGPVLALPVEFQSSQQHALPGTNATSLEDVEREHIRATLEATHWRIEGPAGAAQRLKLTPSTLRYRMGKLGLRRPA